MGDPAAPSHSPPGRQSTGFTPVNGETTTLPPLRPTGPWRSASSRSSPGDTITISTSLNTHNWRPDIREVTESNNDETLKRKRSEGDVDGSAEGTNGRESPKRRQPANFLDSAIDLTSPDEQLSRRAQGPAPSSREPSPVANANQGAPPPEASSATVASLAESAKKFNEAYAAPAYSSPRLLLYQGPTPGDKTPAPAVSEASPEQAQANGQPHDQDDTDPKKRKRSFANRTKTGCHTCRTRKKKCDERRPTCANCERGHFQCWGYGPKPPGLKHGAVSTRSVMPHPRGHASQPQPPSQYQDGSHGPTNYYSQPEPGRTYSHWGGGRHPEESKSANGPDNYPHPNSWRHDSGPTQPPHQHQAPPPPAPSQPTYYPDRPPYGAEYNPLSLPPVYPHPHNGPLPPPLPLPHPPDPFPTHSYTGAGALSVISIHTDATGSSSHSFGNNHIPFVPAITEKDKMLRGLPYSHYTDGKLLRDRELCAAAVMRYNECAVPDRKISVSQRGEWFSQIIEPRKRREPDCLDHAGPLGEIGDYSIVDPPFRCDYGYHIHLGKEVVISAECYLQDGGGIFIGDRTIVGARTQLLTLTASVNATVRGGSQGKARSGAITIGDDVWIGAGCIVLPYVTIGNGAVVGAGSVVTRDVPENTVVAGNPAKFVRKTDSNPDKHFKDALDAQEEKVVKAMQEYVNHGFKQRSPRLI